MARIRIQMTVAACVLGAALFGSERIASAMTTLKQVQVSGGSQVDLLFDTKVQKSQIRTEFFNDVIQISLTEAAVYPAKISSINGGKLVKIFAYQYAPKLVRCRLTVKGRAEDYKDRLELVPNGKLLTVKISDVAVNANAESGTEARLLEHVMKTAIPSKAPTPAAVAKAEATSAQAAPAASAEPASNAAKAEAAEKRESEIPLTSSAKSGARSLKLGGAAPLPSPWAVLGKLMLVIAVFCGAALLFKKISGRSAEKGKGGLIKSLSGTIEEFARSAGASIGGKNKMVEVISNHYLGPKKSISIVRVGEKILVLGVANESINLITELDESELESGFDARKIVAGIANSNLGSVASAKPAGKAAAPSTDSLFADLLKAEVGPAPARREAPVFAAAAAQAAPAGATGGQVRSQIKSRLEGLKQL
ncbi:MAG: flagellar biosynthetic protein FliO [Oligoflexia bacterium]|nr:flagellar biosynthetic protein FliO [Oligoflexia bacterium]